MKILAIETSCDETAAAVLEATDSRFLVLSNVISSQIALHAQYGGVVPSLAAREHVKNIEHVIEAALKEAQTDIKDIDLIAVTHGPGLGPALIVGLTYAKTLAQHYGKPIIGVNHMDGHIHSNWLEPSEPVEDIFPALNVVVSGGHTELVLMRDHGDYEIIGETLDDAVGEAFDKSARLLGLGYPGGPAISKLAEEGNPEKYPLPRPMLHSKDFNFSYSGLKTAVLYLIRDLTKGSPSDASSGRFSVGLTDQQKNDIAASFQDAAIDVLIQKTAKAIKKYEVKAILLSGGVSANNLLRTRLDQLAKENNIKYLCPAMKYTTDNAAMIGVAGYFAYQKQKESLPPWDEIKMYPNLSL